MESISYQVDLFPLFSVSLQPRSPCSHVLQLLQTLCPHWQCEPVILVIAAIRAIFAGNDSVGHRNIMRSRLELQCTAVQCYNATKQCRLLSAVNLWENNCRVQYKNYSEYSAPHWSNIQSRLIQFDSSMHLSVVALSAAKYREEPVRCCAKQNAARYGAQCSVLLGAVCIKETLLLWWTQGKQFRMSGSLRFRPSVPGNEGANTLCISKYKYNLYFKSQILFVFQNTNTISM